jgi:hypothetical protein
MKMEGNFLLELYNGATDMNQLCFDSIFDENVANITIYKLYPNCWEVKFLRDVYEELQKELPTIKKKIIAKAIRELKEESKLFEYIKLNMEHYKLQLALDKKFTLKNVHIDRKLKRDFKNYIKNAFRENRIEWHWWNNLEWGL